MDGRLPKQRILQARSQGMAHCDVQALDTHSVLQGIYGGQHVAIMQCLRKATHTVSEETNLEHLSAELSALVIAQEATENMIQFAEGRMIKLPSE